MLSIDWQNGARYKGRLTVAQLREIIQATKTLGPLQAGALEAVRGNKEAMEVFRKRGFHWADHLQMPMADLIQILLRAFGLTRLLRDVELAEHPAWELKRRLEEDAEQTGPGNASDRKAMAESLGLVFALNSHLDSLQLHGCAVGELIEEGKRGRDGAYLDAIRIDPMVVAVPSFAQRLSVALVAGDEGFLRGVRNALDGKTGRQQESLKAMRYAIRALIEDGQDGMSDAQLWDLFVEKLGVYSRLGAPRNIRKHLNEIRKKSNTSNP